MSELFALHAMSEEAQKKKYRSARRHAEEACRELNFAIMMSDDSSEEDYVNTIKNSCYCTIITKEIIPI